MKNIVNILKRNLGKKSWEVKKPVDGYKKECYIVSDGKQKYFLKFDVPVEALVRLGEINVSPKVIARGQHEGTDYVIQEFIDGVHPEREWLKKNYKEIAKLIKTYQTDQKLRTILAKTETADYKIHLNKSLDKLGEQYRKLLNPQLHQTKVERAFLLLKEEAKLLSPVPLVPIHKEPNTKNMLQRDKKVFFIDWDEITLSDPMNDIGLFLWWYLPKEEWASFLKVFNINLDKEIEEKIYWFAAGSSFEVALWLSGHGYNGNSFLTDFLSAMDKKGNPHGF